MTLAVVFGKMGAMELLPIALAEMTEPEAARLGAEEIALHVFTHNEGAIRLYERLGFVSTRQGSGGMQMTKSL